MTRNIPLTSMRIRREWLRVLGGLPEVSVKNKEWLNLLTEDTRHSLMIEGYFVDKRVLREIILNKKQDGLAYKVLGYFDAALFSYEFAFQQYRTKEFLVSKALIRQMHSLMFKNDPHFQYVPGEWRRGSIVITGSKISPPAFHMIDQKIDELVDFINTSELEPVRKAVMAHAVFEQIHPFPDGDGRVGRILLNFVLVASGLPNIAIKGSTTEEREDYIDALEKADLLVQKVLNGSVSYRLLSSKPLIALEDLISNNLAIALDGVICGRFDDQRHSPLLPINQVADLIGKNVNSFRVACSQKKYICQKAKGRLVTHPDLLKSP